MVLLVPLEPLEPLVPVLDNQVLLELLVQELEPEQEALDSVVLVLEPARSSPRWTPQ